VFRTTHIRTKLAVALAVPLAALVAVAGIELLDAKSQVDRAKSQAQLAEASIGPGSVVVHLQEERNRTYVDLAGLGANASLTSTDPAEARTATDQAASQFRQQISSRGGVVRAAFDPAWTALASIGQLRTDVDGHVDPKGGVDSAFGDLVFQRYTDIIDAFFDGTAQVALSVDDASLRNGATIVDASTRQGEIRTRIVRSIVQAKATGQLDDAIVRQDVAALYDRSQQLDVAIRAAATGAYAGVGEVTLSEPGVQAFNNQIESYLGGDQPNTVPLLIALGSDDTSGYPGLRARAARILALEATKKQDDALAQQTLYAGIALAGLLLTLVITWLASRSITRPLRSLKAQAQEMAGTRLPAAVRQILDTPPGEDVVIPEVQPIEVKARDEVAEVAAALSEVQASAVDLAVEQAVLRRNISDSYINLGRRNQNLLSRQLDFITELERNETDPDALEGLFRLDHLATRMRRNAESLLVLAGIEPPRQWKAPVGAADVVRAALGEVEDYKRVVVAHLEPASVTGAVAAEIAHALAELVENALTFSPPDKPVEVNGRLMTAGYAITVTDYGIGMPPEDLRRANRRLAGKESFTVAPSRYLGHYVAGHLASGLGIKVELRSGEKAGVVASLVVPLRLVVDDEFDRKLAKDPEQEHLAAPNTSGPTAAVVSSETTPSGLPKRGERAQPAPADPDPAYAPVSEPAVAEPVPVGVNGGSAPQPTGIGIAPMTEGPSLFTVTARSGNGQGHGEPEEKGLAGLVRRVPGAQRPDTPVTARVQVAETDEHARSSPDDVYSFLSTFQSGVARGRADASQETPPGQTQEDGR
jgi:signal transduction histidine kinase